MINWLFYSVPEHRKMHYAIMMFLIMFVVPVYLLGLRFTMLGNLVNFLIYDFLYYKMLQVEEHLRKNRDD